MYIENYWWVYWKIVQALIIHFIKCSEIQYIAFKPSLSIDWGYLTVQSVNGVGVSTILTIGFGHDHNNNKMNNNNMNLGFVNESIV